MAPKDVCVLIPRTCEYVTLHGRKDFANVVKIRILSYRDYPGLSTCVQCKHQDLYKTEARESGRVVEGVKTLARGCSDVRKGS